MMLGLRGCAGMILVPLTAYACTPKCINTVVDEVPGPTGGRVAVLYTRACGATTGPSSNVAVVARGVGDPQGIGNVLVLKDPLSMAETRRTTRLHWVSADTLEISLLSGRAVQSKAHVVDGINVIYVLHGDQDP